MLSSEIAFLEQSFCFVLGSQFLPNRAPVFVLVSGGIDYAGTIINSKALYVSPVSGRGIDKSAQILARNTSPSAAKTLYSAMGSGYTRDGLELFYDRTPFINNWSGSVVAGCLAKLKKKDGKTYAIKPQDRLQIINSLQGIFSDLFGEEGELQLLDKNVPSFLQLIVISPLRGKAAFSNFAERLEHVVSNSSIQFNDGPRHLTEVRIGDAQRLIYSRYWVQE